MGGMLFAAAIEIALYTSRLFSTELKWNTLPSLVILPKSIPSLIYAKVWGCLFTLIPVLTYFFLGIVLSPESFAEAISDIFSVEHHQFGVFMMMVSIFLFFIHLVALLSLFVKWGALPLAFAVTLRVGNDAVPDFLFPFRRTWTRRGIRIHRGRDGSDCDRFHALRDRRATESLGITMSQVGTFVVSLNPLDFFLDACDLSAVAHEPALLKMGKSPTGGIASWVGHPYNRFAHLDCSSPFLPRRRALSSTCGSIGNAGQVRMPVKLHGTSSPDAYDRPESVCAARSISLSSTYVAVFLFAVIRIRRTRTRMRRISSWPPSSRPPSLRLRQPKSQRPKSSGPNPSGPSLTGPSPSDSAGAPSSTGGSAFAPCSNRATTAEVSRCEVRLGNSARKSAN